MRRVIAASCVLWLLASAGFVQADPILWVDDANGELGKVDVATGAVTLVGNAGVALTDIAFDPSGNLYGVDFTNLYKIDKLTGAATLVGPHGIPGGNALVFGTDGTLYSAGNSSDSLYTLNPSTGAGTPKSGSLGTESAGDLAFHGSNLYLAGANDDLVLVNPSTGVGSNVGPFGVSNVFGLATADNGVTYAVAGTEVYSVDLATGALTPDVNYGGQGLGDANGAAFFTEAGAGTPEPSSLAFLAVSAAGFLGFRWKRRRATPRCATI